MTKKSINAEKKDRSGLKIKALDVVIIVLLVAVVAGVYFRYNILDMLTGSRNLKEYTVSFEIKDIQYKTENYINVGDKVYYYDSSEELGTLIEASEDAKNALIVVPSTKTFVPEGTNQAVEVAYPSNTRIDATGRMVCKGTFSDQSGFLFKGKEHIAPGDVISVKTELVTVNIIVTDIAPVE